MISRDNSVYFVIGAGLTFDSVDDHAFVALNNLPDDISLISGTTYDLESPLAVLARHNYRHADAHVVSARTLKISGVSSLLLSILAVIPFGSALGIFS